MKPRIARVAWVFAGLTLIGLGGCNPSGKDVDRDWSLGKDVRAGTTDEWRAIQTRQAGRLDALSRFSSAGTLVVRFEDEEGQARTERLNHRLWRVAPDKAALRLSVGGVTGARLGWHGDRWWMLDEMPDRPELRVVDLEADTPRSNGGDEMLAPPTLMAAIGLMPFPQEIPADFVVAGDHARFTLESIRWQEAEGGLFTPRPVRIVVGDPADGPTRIEFLDAEDGVVAVAKLGRFDSVETLGLPPGAWPNLAHRIEVESSRVRRGSWVATFDQPLAQGRISGRLFELDALIERSDPLILEPVGSPTLPVFQSEDGS